MLRVELRALHDGPIETTADVPADAPLLADVDFVLAEAVHVGGRLMESGAGRYYWHGRLTSALTAKCRRCLAEVSVKLDAEVRTLFTEDPAEDETAYAVAPEAGELDLSDMVREELILAVPEYVLCREECQGLCAQCGKDLNDGPCSCRPAPDPRWGALEELKQRLSHDEE
ncbi:MAG: DUF177 domain-containing protein [Gemmatimonadota bacterium]|nr:MAG: DUF177 domain-containing protein [Gemmatimonadota bacterium]